MAEKPIRLDLNPSPELAAALDQWRARQPGLPPRATAARQLLEKALRADGVSLQSTAAATRKAKRKAAPLQFHQARMFA